MKSKSSFPDLESFANHFDDLFFFTTIKGKTNKSEYIGAIEKITGYTREEILKLSGGHYSLVSDSDNKTIKRKLAEFEDDKGKKSLQLEYDIIKKDQSVATLFEKIGAERDDNGKLIKLFGIVLEVSGFKKLQDQLALENENLQSLNSAKDKFLSIISHDLKSPFTTLLGFSEILNNEPDIPQEERDEYLQYIYEASKNQLQMINYLLDYSRLQTGRIQIEPIRLNLRNTISNCVSTLTRNAVEKDITIKTKISPDMAISADERLVIQAFSNIISNAIKYSEVGKQINIVADKFKEGMIEIIIKDEGRGIPEEGQTKIFKIDEKFCLEGTNGEKGTGFGLKLVKEILDKHGGDIWFYSSEEKGSEFHITLPEAKNTILLVEDNNELRNTYKKNLESALPSFDVLEADNGYKAINMVLEMTPTLVITDHDMPLMDGIQLVEAMKKKFSNNYLPVIVISAKLDKDLEEKYSQLGIEKILTKPVDSKKLINIVKEVIY